MFVPRIKNMQNPSWMEGPPTNMCALRALACSSMPVLENKAYNRYEHTIHALATVPLLRGQYDFGNPLFGSSSQKQTNMSRQKDE
jgi:hypothetical protein